MTDAPEQINKNQYLGTVYDHRAELKERYEEEHFMRFPETKKDKAHKKNLKRKAYTTIDDLTEIRKITKIFSNDKQLD